MRVVITRQADKDLRRIDATMRSRIVGKIKQFAADPASLAANVKALEDTDRFRLRVADDRVIYRVDPETDILTIMVVLAVRHRSNAYD